MTGNNISQRRVGHFAPTLLPLLLLLGLAVFPARAEADPITLTGGQVIIDSAQRLTLVNLSGAGLQINSRVEDIRYDIISLSFVTATHNCGCDGVGLVTYNGVGASAFNGGGNFDNTTIWGSITIFGNFDSSLNQSPFTIHFSGSGVLTRDGSRTTFTVTPVPEPATLLLLGAGLAGIGARLRRRRRPGKGVAA